MLGRRGPQAWHETLAENDPRLLAHIHAALERGEDVGQLYARMDLTGVVSLDAFIKYARKFTPANPQIAEVGHLVQNLVAEYPDLSDTERTLLAVLVDKALTAEKASTVAGAMRALNDLLRVRIERRKDTRADEAARMAAAKFDAWKAEYERKERERIDAANRKADKVGRDAGLSQDAIDRIKEIYGLPVGAAGDGRTAA